MFAFAFAIRDLKILGVVLAFSLLSPPLSIGSESVGLEIVKTKKLNETIVERMQEQFKRRNRLSHNELDRLLKEHFDVTKPLEKLADQSLKILYRAVYNAAFYGPNPEHARVLKSISEELAARNVEFEEQAWLQTTDHFQATRNVLLNARLFEEAEQFARAFELSEAGWRIRRNGFLSKTGPTVLQTDLSTTPTVLFHRSVDISHGIKVIVSVHPECGFSRDAMKDVAKSNDLRKELAQKTLWISRQWTTSDLEAIIKWNEKHSATEIVIAYRDEEWPDFVSFHRTPVFYVLNDGSLVHRIVGWPGPEQEEVLMETLATIQRTHGPD